MKVTNKFFMVSLLFSLLCGAMPLFSMDRNKGNRDLFESVRENNVNRARELLGARADMEAIDPAGRTPLIVAAGNRNSAMVRLLLGSRANMESVNFNRETALIVATRAGSPEVVRELIKAGAVLEVEDAAGEMPYDIVARQRNPVLMRALLGQEEPAPFIGQVNVEYVENHENNISDRELMNIFLSVYGAKR